MIFTKTNKASVYKGYKQDKIEMRGDRAEMSGAVWYMGGFQSIPTMPAFDFSGISAMCQRK